MLGAAASMPSVLGRKCGSLPLCGFIHTTR